jgi:hypothetical protein
MESSSFPVDGRGKYEQIMRDAGYVEDKSYVKAAENKQGYFCNTCEYFKSKFNSPTDYWCNKYLFPDRKFGCCNGWEREKKT